MTCPLHSLSDGSLRAVAASLRSGVLAAGMSQSEIQRTCGGASGAVCEYLGALYADGFSPKHIPAIVQAVLDLRTSALPHLGVDCLWPGSAGRASRRHVLRDARPGPDCFTRGDSSGLFDLQWKGSLRVPCPENGIDPGIAGDFFGAHRQGRERHDD